MGNSWSSIGLVGWEVSLGQPRGGGWARAVAACLCLGEIVSCCSTLGAECSHPAAWKLCDFTGNWIWLSGRVSFSSIMLLCLPSTHSYIADIETCLHFFGLLPFCKILKCVAVMSPSSWSPTVLTVLTNPASVSSALPASIPCGAAEAVAVAIPGNSLEPWSHFDDIYQFLLTLHSPYLLSVLGQLLFCCFQGCILFLNENPTYWIVFPIYTRWPFPSPPLI